MNRECTLIAAIAVERMNPELSEQGRRRRMWRAATNAMDEKMKNKLPRKRKEIDDREGGMWVGEK